MIENTHIPDASLIRLVAFDVEKIDAMVVGEAVFEQKFGLEVKKDWLDAPEVMPFMRIQSSSVGREDYMPQLLILPYEKAVVGLAGMKDRPRDRRVEIGYGIAREYRRHGYATEAVRRLLAMAAACGEVDIVEAETSVDNAASAAVLKRCDFRQTGQIWRKEDGQMLVWEKRLDAGCSD